MAWSASCSRPRSSRRRRRNGPGFSPAQPGTRRRCSASLRLRRMPPARCSTPRSRSCMGSTGCARTWGGAARSCCASTMCTGLTRPRCASCTTWGEELGNCRVAVVAAARPAEPTGGSPLLAALAADPSAEVLVLAPLSVHAVAELVRLGLGTGVEPAFAAVCHQVTGGVPFLVHELVRAIAEAGIEPTAAAASRVAALAPHAVSHSVVHRLSRLSAAARELAPAAAVLGEADLRLAADLAGLDPGAAATAADELAAAGILEEGRPLQLRPPDRPGGGRGRSAARRAGWPARGGGAAPRGRGRVCAPRRSPPAGDRPGRGRLGRRFTRVGRQDRDRQRRTGLDRRLSAAGAGRAAVGAAPPRRPARAGLRRVLRGRPAGGGSSRAGTRCRGGNGRPGLDHSRAGTHAADRGPQPGGAGRCSTGPAPASPALTGARRSRSRAPPSERPSSTRRPRMMPHSASPASAGWPRKSPTFRRASSACWRSPPRWRTNRRRRPRASRSARLTERRSCCPRQSTGPRSSTTPASHSRSPNATSEALARFDDALADARRLGSLPHVLGLSCYRAFAHLRIGNLADAEADARVALETGPRLPGFHAAVALAVLLETLAERGQLQAAEAADERYRLAEQFPTMVQGGWLLAARGRLRLAELRPAAALDDLLAAGELFTRLRSPSSDRYAVALRRRPRAPRARRTSRSQSARRRRGRARPGLQRPAHARDSPARGRPRRGRTARHRAAAPGGSACSRAPVRDWSTPAP